MEALRFTETSVSIYRSEQRDIPADFIPDLYVHHIPKCCISGKVGRSVTLNHNIIPPLLSVTIFELGAVFG
jgi:hypothetical protein